MWIQLLVDEAGEGEWLLMSQLTQCIQKLSEVQVMVHHVSDMLALSRKVQELPIASLSMCIEDISDMQQEVVQELLVLQQVQDSELALKVDA